MRIGRASAQCGHTIAPPKRVPIEQPAEKIERRRQGRTGQPAACALTIDELDVEARLHRHAMIGADLPQKRERLVVASQQHVLAVVDPLPGQRDP